ncbi:MAG: pyrroloquinoline quinone-dependent dehydrogenase [Gemmatimonadales bacterium]
MNRIVLLSFVLAACAGQSTDGDDHRDGRGDWPAYGRTSLGDRHSPLGQLSPGNVGRLEVAWRYHTGETGPEYAGSRPTMLEATPVVVEGTMYLSTPLGRVVALDPVTGQQRWVHDAAVDRMSDFGDFASRGVSVWRDSSRGGTDPCARRVFVATIDGRLIGLDAGSGSPCPDFGRSGVVDLLSGLRNRPHDLTEYEQTSPPAIVNGLVILGSAVADNSRIDAPSGAVRAFDARSGALRWTWDPVPQDPSDSAYGTWIGPHAHATGAANAWSVLAADPARDLVFIPTGSPSVDYYGGERKGANRYANSIVALRASTGQVVWDFQTVHHDLWDYDNASPPALVTLHRNGRDVAAVLQATKTGQLFVLERDTGEPLFPVEERRVPPSDVPGEEAWPTQPASSGLPALSPQRLGPDDVWGPTDADRDACRARLAELRNDGPFTPPSERGSLMMPSNAGGAHWGGVAYDPERQIAVVPTNRIAAVITLIPRAKFEASMTHTDMQERIGLEYAQMRGTPYVLKREVFLGPSNAPCTPPPFGALVGISLESGKELWITPLGTGEGLERYGVRVGPDVRGMVNLGGAITTGAGLTFIAASPDAYLRAFDTGTGRELWKAKLPAGGKATPMTYLGRDGRQYVVIAAGGDGKLFGRADEIVAFALPGR